MNMNTTVTRLKLVSETKKKLRNLVEIQTYIVNLAWMKQNQIKLLKVYSGQKNELAKTILAV